MRKTVLASIVLGALSVAPAQAVTFLGAGSSLFADTGVTFDGVAIGTSPSGVLSGGTGSFSGNGTVQLGTTSGQYATPAGDTTPYLAVQANQSVTISFGATQNFLSLFLGSADAYNTFAFFNGATAVGYFTGDLLLPSGNGDQLSAATNAFVNFQGPFDRLVLSSLGQNSLEVDSITASVPELSTWAMLIFGFAGIGFAAYRNKNKPAFRIA